MRRRSFHLLVAIVMVGCGGAPEPAPALDEPFGRGDAPDVLADTAAPGAERPGVRPLPADTPALGPSDLSSDTTEMDGPWNEARARGVDFRAIGQEPGWFLEIDEGTLILFAYDYGAERTTLPAPEPYRDDRTGRTTYRVASGDGELVVIIEAEPCFDTMSGEAFDKAVTVSFDSREYRGCGRVL